MNKTLIRDHIIKAFYYQKEELTDNLYRLTCYDCDLMPSTLLKDSEIHFKYTSNFKQCSLDILLSGNDTGFYKWNELHFALERLKAERETIKNEYKYVINYNWDSVFNFLTVEETLRELSNTPLLKLDLYLNEKKEYSFCFDNNFGIDFDYDKLRQDAIESVLKQVSK